ncbi:MAG TPA: hypothetical protein VI279_14720, partial [Rhodocyclaceae bacterium]
MQKFNQKRIAVAIGALLAAGAGTAIAAPALRTANPALAQSSTVTPTAAQAQALFSAAGSAYPISVQLGFNDFTTTAHTNFADSTATNATTFSAAIDSTTAITFYMVDSTGSGKVYLNALIADSTGTASTGVIAAGTSSTAPATLTLPLNPT